MAMDKLDCLDIRTKGSSCGALVYRGDRFRSVRRSVQLKLSAMSGWLAKHTTDFIFRKRAPVQPRCSSDENALETTCSLRTRVVVSLAFIASQLTAKHRSIWNSIYGRHIWFLKRLKGIAEREREREREECRDCVYHDFSDPRERCNNKYHFFSVLPDTSRLIGTEIFYFRQLDCLVFPVFLNYNRA